MEKLVELCLHRPRLGAEVSPELMQDDREVVISKESVAIAMQRLIGRVENLPTLPTSPRSF